MLIVNAIESRVLVVTVIVNKRICVIAGPTLVEGYFWIAAKICKVLLDIFAGKNYYSFYGFGVML